MSEDTLNQARSFVNTKPLAAIDYALASLRSKNDCCEDTSLDSPGLRVFAQAILKSQNVAQDVWRANPIDSLFSTSLSFASQRFVAVCLLRLLPHHRPLFDIMHFRHRALDIIDRTLGPELYGRLAIGAKSASHEKLGKLADLVPQVEDNLWAVINSLESLAILPQFRQRYMQQLNSPLSKSLIWPFLPRELLDIRLNQTFTLSLDYVDQHASEAVQVFQQAEKDLQAYIRVAEQRSTRYSRDYLAEPIWRLLKLIREHFEQSPLSKPASLEIVSTEKKYPLQMPGARVTLALKVNNLGPGYAYDVAIAVKEATDLYLEKDEIYLGNLNVDSLMVEIPARVTGVAQSVLITAKASWLDYDKSARSAEVCIELFGQRTEVDWDALVGEDPFSLEPITADEDLIGRDDILQELVARADGRNVGSSYIHGQKRVGKTSIARSLVTRLEKRGKGFIIVYLEGGDYVHPDASETIANLGRMIAEQVTSADVKLAHVPVPQFTGALSPLNSFLLQVQRISPERRFVFVLDEFDELPLDLYKPTGIGNAFFLTLRTLSGRPPIGFVLIGSEKMEFILSLQGDALNKFKPVRVDYFEKEHHWKDFQDLVRRPLDRWRLELSDAALTYLYDHTAGNPYFTKLVCQELFRDMVKRRDAHATEQEVQAAITATVLGAGANSFMHFWTDGIMHVGERAEDMSLTRRKVLLAFAETLREHLLPTPSNISKQAERFGLSEQIVESELRDFERRKVLIRVQGHYRCKVQLFEKWLTTAGARELLTSFTDVDAMLAYQRQESEAQVSAAELASLTETWGPYRGSRVTADAVRAWLIQFGGNVEQRLMFRILQAISFYSGEIIREKLHEAQGIIDRGLIRRMKNRQVKRGDILVSYLDAVGKSGAHFARVYADENQIYYGNVVEQSELANRLSRVDGPCALVFLDDFIGTGDSAVNNLRKLNESCGAVLRERNVPALYIAICGFESAKAKIDRETRRLQIPVQLNICDPLNDAARVFGPESAAFADPNERERAKRLAMEYGERLVKNAPLGYGGGQATVVFETNCPNNSLPVLWAERQGWRPIFKRA